MSNFYETLLNNNLGRSLLKNVGLPTPINLKRYNANQETYFEGRVLVGASDNAALLNDLMRNLKASNAKVFFPSACKTAAAILKAAEANGVRAVGVECKKDMTDKFDAFVFDATGFSDTEHLNQLYFFFNPVMRKLNNNGRVIVLGRPHMKAATGEQAAAMRALEGFTRSVAKEIGKKSATAQSIYVEEGAEANIDSAFRFVISAKSAYMDGQILTVSKADVVTYPEWHKPLAGKVALVTGAARGIGESIARTLARDGATVLGLDIPPAEGDLKRVMAEIGGEVLLGDISSKEAPAMISAKLKEMGGGDIIVHNAGVTRDKTLANMPEHWWSMTIAINLSAEEHINNQLFADGTINDGGSIICVSSMNGIAGQVGQTNYAASKAGVIGYVQYMADELAKKNITINAVAPGFIETQMTDAIPFMTREVGRRLNSLSQGGKPVDVAETIAFFGNPASSGVTGNVVRICGQSLVGA
ncbi:3-oxoacyl-ACP reductase [Thalassolituus oleivorans]|uniref:3-ketoacyl-(Acyl-carrier-protein) reductase n=1 Tax=Thalassolituus oleivorans MIL-1 TaxID=1298593 RepID=M5DR92_9GAMM|nr:3-oxoacyl-ACP reductase [Thalassolituus oleivorans]CCU71667.1 3-ketoacyl-(acyl-carrier-protein) reductase [Thalassolituus oleivorans MIL-1]